MKKETKKSDATPKKPSREEMDQWIGYHYVAISDLVDMLYDFFYGCRHGSADVSGILEKLELMQNLYRKPKNVENETEKVS